MKVWSGGKGPGGIVLLVPGIVFCPKLRSEVSNIHSNCRTHLTTYLPQSILPHQSTLLSYVPDVDYVDKAQYVGVLLCTLVGEHTSRDVCHTPCILSLRARII